MSLERFEEWLEKKYPEHIGLIDDFTDDLNAEHEENDKLWGEYLEKYGREVNCPNCDNPIFYVLPRAWGMSPSIDMTIPDSFLMASCLHCPTTLTIKNSKGKIEQEFALLSKE